MDLAHPLRATGKRLLDTLLPLRCLGCGVVVETGALCTACWSGLDHIAAPACARCGLPFGHDEGPDALCGGCLAEPPAFDRARAALRYNDLSARLIIGFKHSDKLHHLDAFVRWLERAAGADLAGADLVCCVPLHRRRLWHRRFNQSALLANALARCAGKVSAPDLLVRRRATPSQAGLNRRQRIDNLRGAMIVRSGMETRVSGRRILLVDDVYTTGATVDACAKALRRAGADHIGVVTLARVVRETT
jgi:ComF family protein